MKRINNFIYVVPDDGCTFVNIGGNFIASEKEKKMLEELDNKLQKLIEKYNEKLNKES